jgi:hypothetical protein
VPETSTTNLIRIAKKIHERECNWAGEWSDYETARDCWLDPKQHEHRRYYLDKAKLVLDDVMDKGDQLTTAPLAEPVEHAEPLSGPDPTSGTPKPRSNYEEALRLVRHDEKNALTYAVLAVVDALMSRESSPPPRLGLFGPGNVNL